MAIVVREKAEAEMLDLIRRQDIQNFSLSVACSNGRWTVVAEDLDSVTGRAIGEGGSFTEAWFNQQHKPARRVG